MPPPKASLTGIAKKLDSIESRLKHLESSVVAEEKREEQYEIDEEKELAEIEEIEKKIAAEVVHKPLAKITYRDFTRGIIGAFVGIVGHFAFFYGSKLAAELSLARAHALIITSLGMLILFFLFTGFRKVRKKSSIRYLPQRIAVIFVVSHAVIAFVLLLFGVITADMSVTEIYKNVAAVSILAVLGAATADLLGENE